MAVFDALAEMLAGDAAAAERALDDAERVAIEIGDRWFESTIRVDRAHAILAQDRPDAAAEAVARIDDIPAPSDMEWLVKRHAARAKLAALEGDADRALGEARTATALADATGMFTFRADAHRDLAEVATRCGGTRRRAPRPPPRSRCTRPRRTSPPRRGCERAPARRT